MIARTCTFSTTGLRHLARFGFGRALGPVEPVEYLDRSAWRFRFAPPEHKPWDMRVVVDDITGLILEQRFGPDHVTRWTEFRTEVQLDPGLFVWNGPVQDLAPRARYETYLAGRDRAEWFAAHVAADLVVPWGPVEVEVRYHESDGAFRATLSGVASGQLARRVRSVEWWSLGWREVHHRWSDARFDWALTGDDGPFDVPTVEALRAQLRPT